ncbi:hypothetical protein [Pelagibacterium montanilacus]|uniref:hypothetical protein n=1 Tax=Pelagibacterium montanilacus TaxID=2185280 RepID=UPI0013DFE683|nr:hypothetical protein [Pelagibacterium montanilacus]
MTVRSARTLLATGAISLAAVNSAFAVEPDAFGDRLVSVLDTMGLAATVGEARQEDDAIVLSGVTIDVPGEAPVAIPGDLVFSAVSEDANGDFLARSASVEDFSVELPAMEREDAIEDIGPQTLSVSGIAFENIVLPASGEYSHIDAYRFVSRASVGPITLEAEGETLLSIGAMDAWSDASAGDAGLVSGFEIADLETGEGLDLDFAELGLPAALDRDGVSTDIVMETTWNVEAGEIELTEGRISLDQLATLEMSGVFAGYDLAFYDRMMEINRAYLELPAEDSAEDMAALDADAIDTVMDLELASFDLRYTDQALLAGLFESDAELRGTAQGFAGLATLLLAGQGDEALAQSVGEALDAFVADPQSLHVSLAPDTPLPLSVLADPGMDPVDIIARLNLSVTANAE